MVLLKNLDALELFAFVKTDEGRDILENWIRNKPVPVWVAKAMQQSLDLSAKGALIDANVKKITTIAPSKNIYKQLAIDKFVLKKQKDFTLSWQETHDLWNSIMIGIILKGLHLKDFVWQNGEIESISGIDFSDKTRVSNNAGFI
jgi:hypothetical protein